MNTQYTPGPWSNFGNLAMDSKGRTIAKACVLSDFDEEDANARLIAASPTLYEFAKRKAQSGDSEAKSMLASLGLCD